MGDPFRVFFEQHFDYVYRSLRRLGVYERDLEDLTHDVFLEVRAAMSRFDPERPAKPWLFAFAFRLASDYRRLARHRTELVDVIEAPCGDSTDLALEQAENRALLARALASLDMDQRAILVLHEIDEVPVPQIAESLGIPLNTAYSRLRAGRAAVTAAVHRERARQR